MRVHARLSARRIASQCCDVATLSVSAEVPLDVVKTQGTVRRAPCPGRIEGDHFAFVQAVEDFDHLGRILADFDFAPLEAFVVRDEADLLAAVGSDGLMRDRQHVIAP